MAGPRLHFCKVGEREKEGEETQTKTNGTWNNETHPKKEGNEGSRTNCRRREDPSDHPGGDEVVLVRHQAASSWSELFELERNWISTEEIPASMAS